MVGSRRADASPQLFSYDNTSISAMKLNQDTTASRPKLRISVVPFRLSQSGLQVAVRSDDSGALQLLAGTPDLDEWLDSAARRIVRDWVGSNEQYLEQLYTFSHTTGSDRTVTVSYLALFRDNDESATSAPGITWMVAHEVPLPSDVDRRVRDYALRRLQAKIGYTNIAFHLLRETFTFSELQLAYEWVLDHPVDKRNFRRRMMASGILDQMNEKRRDGSHRPAALYRFASRDDQAAYLTPPWAAERFESRVELPLEGSVRL